jgi:cobalt/nickel transport system permease protein
MKDKAALLLYLAALVAATSVHDLRFLGALLAVALLLSGRSALRFALRTVRAILFFNGIVTLSYLALSHLRGSADGRFLLLMNLRVFTLTFLTFLFVSKTNPLRAFSFSRSLIVLLSLAYGQVAVFRRLLVDFRLAMRSRSPRKPGTTDLYRRAGAAGAFFLERALHDSEEIAQAMRSRGFTP